MPILVKLTYRKKRSSTLLITNKYQYNGTAHHLSVSIRGLSVLPCKNDRLKEHCSHLQLVDVQRHFVFKVYISEKAGSYRGVSLQ